MNSTATSVNVRRKTRFRRLGFSLTELVVVSGLAAAVFTTAALAYRTITRHQRSAASYQEVELGPAITKAFYGSTTGTLDVYTAPNFGMTARAEVLRNIFWDDVAHANAVFCLPRAGITVDTLSDPVAKVAGVNYIHPELLPTPNPNNLNPPPDPQASFAFSGLGTFLDHPNSFLTLLQGLYPNSTTHPFPFLNQAYRGVPDTAAVNGSIFILQHSSEQNKLALRAVYDIDFLAVATPEAGTYASVKRFVPIKADILTPDATGLTHFYDVFYAGSDQSPTQFGPIFACFERSVRKAVAETSNDKATAFKRAGNRPFYFIWWPDPATPRLAGAPIGTYSATDPRRYYSQHENQTTWMFTVPMFPPL